ncbi:MAG: hypothetical protein ACRCZF_21240, partial [Gemmataceae bacterium]
QNSGPGGKNRAKITLIDYNLEFQTPPAPWAKDPSPIVAARANLFNYRYEESEVRIVFAASDYRTRNPSPGDLRESLLDRMRGILDDLEPTEERGATWCGLPAIKYIFRGVHPVSKDPYAGEGLTISQQGVGYWTIAWAAEKEVPQHVDAFEQIRSNFRLLNTREGWKETTLSMTTFNGEAVDYRILDTERWWKRPEGLQPTDIDPAADLILTADYKSKRTGDRKPRAELAAYLLPASNDPGATLKTYIQDRYTKRSDLFGPTKLNPINTEPQGDPPGNTELPLRDVVRLHAESVKDPATSRLLILSAVTTGGKTVGVEVSCPWSERHLWERRLMQIAGTLQPGK